MARNPSLSREMDRWSCEENLWLRRAAITHQLGRGEKTDEARLFRYCAENAADAASNPGAVRTFVAQNQETLSPLSVREALKHL